MPTRPYMLQSGDRVPGVTTVIGSNLAWNKQALMAWANREGLAGRDIRGDRSTAKLAADRGTAVHAMIEAATHGYDPDQVPDLLALGSTDYLLAQTAFGSFVRWQQDCGLRLVATEVYGIIEERRFGFCADALALRHTGQLCLIDYKTGKGPYPDHFIQVAAYAYALTTLYPEWIPFLDGAYVLRASSSGAYHHVYWPNEALVVGLRAFNKLLELHGMKRQIEAFVH